MELTQQSIYECIARLRCMVDDKDELIANEPSHFYVWPEFVTELDRMANPWKGKRAKWLSKKR